MKGIIIYGNPMWDGNEGVTYCEFMNEASLELTHYAPKTIMSCLKGGASECSKALCSKDDEYDFKTGALIALMKMCGLEKSAKAYAEIFDDTAYGDALIERDKLERLLRYAKDDINKKLEYIKKKDEEIEQLKEKNSGLYNLARKYVDEIDQKDHEIISLKALKRTNENLKKDNEAFRKTCEKLKEENEWLKNTRDLLISKNNELIEKKKDLKKKLNAMYGYIDTDNVKPELPRTLDINGTTYHKEISLKDLHKEYNFKRGVMITGWSPEKDFIGQTDKLTGLSKFTWELKIPTKREHMWAEIFALHKESDVVIKVKKEDANTFFHEIENKIPEITWLSNIKIFETKYTIGDIYEALKTCDAIYFRLHKRNKLTYSIDPHIYPYRELKSIDYLPPMRWDLFKKGRIVVGCTEEKIPEFREKVVKELGNVRMEKYSVENLHCNGPIKVYFHYDKDTNWLKPLLVSGIPRFKVNNHKVVYWEDVR